MCRSSAPGGVNALVFPSLRPPPEQFGGGRAVELRTDIPSRQQRTSGIACLTSHYFFFTLGALPVPVRGIISVPVSELFGTIK